MGALEIKNAKLRCGRCLDIRRLLIIPSITEPKIEIMCHCNKSIENLLDFFKEINNVTDIKLICSKCNKELIKHPRFCYDCLQVYCSKCCENHLPRINNNDDIPIRTSLIGHTTIHIEKLDYYCVDHQNEVFMAYCQQCLMNLCNECLREGTHKFHQVDLFSVIQPTNKEKEDVKNGIKKSEHKIERTNKKISTFCKLYKDDSRVKEIEEKYKLISEENNDILALMKFCFNLYKSSKLKNYSIIYNIIKNMKFNSKKLVITKQMTKEEKYNQIIKYFKKDALIFYRRKKTDIEKFESDNEQEEEDEKEEEKIKIKEKKEKKEKKLTNNNNYKNYNNNDYNNQEENEEQENEIIYELNDNDNNNDNNNVIENNENNNDDKNNIIENEENNIDENNIEDEENNNEENNENNYNENKEEENQEKDINENLKINEFQQEKNQYKNEFTKVNTDVNEHNLHPKKLKIPIIFNLPPKKESTSDIPRPKKLKMPSMFEKHQEEKKNEKPLQVKPTMIKTGTVSDINSKKDFLAQMLKKKSEIGMGFGGKINSDNNRKLSKEENKAPIQEKIEIIHDTNEGNTEEIINKVAVTNKKKKKPKRSKAFGFGEEFIELPKPKPKPEVIVENSENNENDDNNENKENTENIEIINNETNENIENNNQEDNIENNNIEKNIVNNNVEENVENNVEEFNQEEQNVLEENAQNEEQQDEGMNQIEENNE